MNVFESFKQGVIEIRSKIEKFKGDHVMTSNAISEVIDLMPEPFNKFGSVIWNGLEKEGEEGSVKLLEVLEKIKNNNEQSFSQIMRGVSELVQSGAKSEDIQKLGEQIRISNEAVIQNLKEALNIMDLKKTAVELNFDLVTSKKKYGKGDRDCWKKAYFRDEDITSEYDARRIPITDEIINSIKDNIGTIVYGKPYYGKSILLKRVMFEEIQNGYSIIYIKGSNVKVAANTFIEFLNRVLIYYPKLLVIADNVHEIGSEIVFQAYNRFSEKEDVNHNYNIRFLFAARKEEFDIARENISDWELKQEFEDALDKIKNSFNIGFEKDDAKLYLTKAIFVTPDQVQLSEEDIKDLSDGLYDYSNHDPFMFIFAIRYYLLQGRSETFDFIETDIREKIESLDKEEELWKAALLCSFMGMFGIMPIQVDKPSSYSRSIIIECGNIDEDYLHYLSSNDVDFLFKDEKGGYKVRHEQWAVEFLIYIYNEKFNNYINDLFGKRQYKIDQQIKIKKLIRDGVKQLISCILNNIEIYDHLNILNRCSSLFNGYERSKPICKLFVDNYVNNYIILNKLNDREKSQVNTGLGSFYVYTKEFNNSLQFFDKAIEIDPKNVNAWYNKGVALGKLERSEEAIECYDKAIELNVK